MYKYLIKPLLFQFTPEVAHHLVFNLLKVGKNIGLKPVISGLYNNQSLQMETMVCGLKFPNKVGIAAGLDKNAEAFEMLGSLGFGHIEIGTVTPKGQPGNPKPRSFRLIEDHAIINRMGFNNNGLDAAIEKLKNRSNKLIVGGNIGKNTATPNELALGDYITCFNGLYDYVDYITVNVSCPNISNLSKLQDQDELENILNALDKERNNKDKFKPIFLKISPDLNFQQIDETLDVINRCNINGIIAVNTTTTRDNLQTDVSKINEIGNGGLSGKPLKERSNEIIRYISDRTKGELPIIGIGGIESPQDAIEKLNAGASLVQVYTGFIYSGPGLAKKINRRIKKELQK